MVELHDTLILDAKARRLRTGELAASVRCARTGLQDYAGYEVGKPELERVTVYRPENEVMKRDSLITFAGVPVTVEHPREPVTTDNWKRYAVGESGEEVVRDGEFIRVPILVRDEGAINAIQDGKRQISMGYSCELKFEDGVTPDGQPYQAVQRNIKINHLAIVDQARGGSALTITDERTYSGENPDGINDDTARRETSNSGGSQVATKTITFDGLPLEVTDAAEAAITQAAEGQIKSLSDAQTTAASEIRLLSTAKDNHLHQGRRDRRPQQKGRGLGPEAGADREAGRRPRFPRSPRRRASIRGRDGRQDRRRDPQGRRQRQARRRGRQAMDDAAIAGAFAVLAKDVKPIDPVRNALSGGTVTANDAKAEYRPATRSGRPRSPTPGASPPPPPQPSNGDPRWRSPFRAPTRRVPQPVSPAWWQMARKSNRISRTVEDAAGIAFGKAAFRGSGDHGVTGTPAAPPSWASSSPTPARCPLRRDRRHAAAVRTAALLNEGVIYVSARWRLRTATRPTSRRPASSPTSPPANTAIPAKFDATTSAAGIVPLRVFSDRT
jgi:hypothetical protein